MPVIFACAAHDLARTDDEYNEIHWERAVPLVNGIMESFSDILTEEQKENIVYNMIESSKLCTSSWLCFSLFVGCR